MAISRKKALERLEALAPRVEDHLIKIETDPDSEAVDHCHKEKTAWPEQIRLAVAHTGKRTGEMWLRKKMNGVHDWRNNMATVSQSLERLLADVFEHSRDNENGQTHAKQKSEFVFHMTDCRNDLLRLAELYREPERYNETDAKEIIAATLYHAVGHLIAAARLYDYVPDPFKPPE